MANLKALSANGPALKEYQAEVVNNQSMGFSEEFRKERKAHVGLGGAFEVQ